LMVSFNFPIETVVEGSVHVAVPRIEVFGVRGWGEQSAKAPVFYNPRMRLNRDIAVLALLAHHDSVQRRLEVCEPMAGTGVRGIRFAAHGEAVKSVVLGDLNPEAILLMAHNLSESGLSSRVSIYHIDANTLLSLHSAPAKRFDFIDIDPFGSPSPFLDSAVRSVRSGGIIALTATDTASLCGVYPEACLRKYYSKPLRTEYCHELALRILAGALASVAARHEFGVNIVFGHSTDHYVRVYAKMTRGPREADESLMEVGFIDHCLRCMNRTWRRGLFSRGELRCGVCGGRLSIAGPLWLGGISDREFCRSMIEQVDGEVLSEPRRVGKLLQTVMEESGMPPTYFRIDRLCDRLGVPTPSKSLVINGLRGRGFCASGTHFSPQGVKTDAAVEVVCECILEGLKEAEGREDTASPQDVE